MADRHRASGDALATVKLFKILLERFERNCKRFWLKSKVPQNYWILWLAAKQVSITFTMKGNLIYIVKARNIKRINQHFTGTSKMQKYKPEVFPQLQYEGNWK
jgi:DNA polymerase-3 subunit epsilon